VCCLRSASYEFSAETRFVKLFAGVEVECPWYIKDGDRGREDITPKTRSTRTTVGC